MQTKRKWIVLVACSLAGVLCTSASPYFVSCTEYSGAGYAGCPLAFWHIPPYSAAARRWTLDPLRLVIDVVVWTTLFYLPCAFAIWSIVALKRCVHRYDRSLLCKTCGYDLRGLPEPRCPECGAPFTNSQVRSWGARGIRGGDKGSGVVN
jgi:hypothetical protein